MGAVALETLLGELIDYAGLFPPAALSMSDAVSNHAQYISGPERRMLGRFIVPLARLDELAAAVAGLGARRPSASRPWRVAVIAGAADAATLRAFVARHGGTLVVDTIEAKAESPEQIPAIAAALGAHYTVYVEVPVRSDPTPFLSALAVVGLRAKIRTGGVTADAFPAPAEVMRFLAACVEMGVPFKATAGLHHPLRGEYRLTYAADAPHGTMYGFMNIFLTAAMLRAGHPAAAIAPLLEERDAASLVVAPSGLTWRGFTVTTAQLAAARTVLAASFGSCSFAEPVEDLHSLRLL
ncbi:MAG: hypothetical protein ACKVS7_07330 [Gemmatimonadaceae bacterium]